MGRTVSLFRNGRNQAVRIPREFELPGTEAVMRRDGDRLVIEPVARPTLVGLLEGLAPLQSDDGPDPVARPAPEPVDL